MAKNTVTLTITIDKKQADNALNNIKAQMESLQKSIKATKEKLNDKSLWGENDSVDKLSKQIKALKNEYRTLNKAYESGVFQMKGIDAQLQEISNANYNNLTSLRTTLQNSLKNMKFESESYKEAAERLQAVRDEIAKRDVDVRGSITKDKAQKVMSNVQDYSVSEIEKAIETTKKLRDMQPDAAKWKEYNEQIVQAKKHLDDFNSSIKKVAMKKQLIQLPSISDQAISEQKRYWQEVINGAELSDPHLAKYKKHLADITQEEENRASKKAGAVMGNLQNYSISEIEEAIKLTEKLQKAQKPGSQEWSIYGEEIKKAKEYLQSYIDLDKQINMEDKWSHLSSLSADALAEQKKYWQEMVNGAENGSNKLERYTALLEKVKKEESDRLLNRYEKVLQNPTDYSVSEIQNATKAFEKIRDEQNAGSLEWKHYNSIIETTKETLKSFENEAKGFVMNERFKTIDTASANSLSEQKKYWQEMVDSAQKGSAALDEYKDKLSQVIAEERKRIQESGKELVDQYESGNWNKTIGETEEAIKQLKEYRNTLNQDIDTDSLEKVDNILSKLTQKAKESERGFISLDEALEKSTNLDNFNGTIEDLENLKKRLQEIRDTEMKLSFPGAKGKLIEIETALDGIDSKIDEVNRGSFNLDSVLKHLDTSSMKQLNRAAEELKRQIDSASVSSAKFVTYSNELRRVNKKISEAKELWKEKENIITKTAKRLASYVVVYAGFNEIVGKLKEVARANLQLSDSLADIQKTTGLSAESVSRLSDQINRIDTRTAQKELHDLAYEAGKLGISAEEDVLSFVRAGNQLLVALGEDLGGAEAVRQLMKVNAVLGETQKLGVEKALLATGSAINEISQTSRASAGPIADIVKRIGAIGAASNLTMADLVALAGTADALGQSAEVSGTAFNKFLGTLQSNTTDVAYTLGLDPSRLKDLLSNEKTAIYGIIEIFEKMNLKGGMADLSPLMKELGSEGARMTQVLTTMAGGVEELKAQVFTANQAFKEATSVTNEYNIKNESAAAIIERIGNNIREMFTNSTVVNAMKSFLQWLYYLPNALERNRFLLNSIRLLLWQISSISFVKLIAMISGGMGSALATATKALKAFNIQAANSILLGGDMHGNWIKNTLRALAFAKGLDKVKIAFAVLGKVIKANPIFFIGSAIAGIITMVRSLTENTEKAAQAQAEFSASVAKEQFELSNLLSRINDANSANGERASLIQELNGKYGQYLGFMVTEANYLNNQNYIRELLNAQIERSISLKMREKLVSDISAKYADKQRASFEQLSKILSSIPGIGEGGASIARSNIFAEITTQIENGARDIEAVLASVGPKIWQEAAKKLNEQFKNNKITIEEYRKSFNQLSIDTFGQNVWNLKAEISKLFDIQQSIFDETKVATDLSRTNIESLDKKVLSTKQKEADKVLESIQNISDAKELTTARAKLSDYIRLREQSVSAIIAKQNELNSLNYNQIEELDALIKKQAEGNELTEEEADRLKELQGIKAGTLGLETNEIELLSALNKKKSEGVELSQEELQTYTDLQKKKNAALGLTEDESNELIRVNSELEKYKKGLDDVKIKLAAAGDFSLWGEGRTIKDVDVNQLVSMYKKLESDAKKIEKGAYDSVQTLFWKGFTDQKKAIRAYYDEAKAIKDELESRGFNPSGHFKWPGGDGGAKEQARKEYQAAISAFNAYWKEYETHIKRRAQDEDWTPQTLIRKELEMEQTREKERVELYKALLGETNEFKKDLYIGMITGVDYFANKELDALAASLKHFGIDMEDGLRHSLAKALLKYEDVTLKSKKNLEKLLLEDDYTGKVLRQYMNTLDELGLLFGINDGLLEESTEENGRRRLAYMREWAKEAYNIDAKGLKERMAENELFNAWMEDRSEEDYETLLSQLRKFNDDMAEAEKRAAQRRKRIFDSSDKGMALKAAIESKSSDKEVEKTEAEMWDRFSGMGLATDNEVLRQQIDVSNAQIALYQSKIDASKAYIEQMNKEMEAQRNKLSLEIESLQKEIEYKRKFGIDTMQLEADLLAKKQDYDSLKRQSSIATKEANQEIEESQQKISDTEEEIARKLHEIEQKRLSEAKKYTDAIIEFSSAMTEADWDDVESRQEAAKALVKSLLTTLKDWASIKLTELTMKQMFANQSNAISGQEAIGGLTAKGAEVEGSIAANSTEATANAVGKYGLKGLLIGAAISAALTALMNVALKAIFKSKSEIAAATGASNGKLATGMLNYAKGNYPVLGNDGQVYNAKYEGSNIQTGIYRGGAHFGIFSEKKPEAIIDGDTTQRLIMNHPDIWKAIVTLSKTGRLSEGYGMRTFNSGNINELAKDIANVENNVSSENNIQMAQMQAIIENNNRVIAQLTNILSAGIQANINMYGDNGMYKSMRKAERFASKRGV